MFKLGGGVVLFLYLFCFISIVEVVYLIPEITVSTGGLLGAVPLPVSFPPFRVSFIHDYCLPLPGQHSLKLGFHPSLSPSLRYDLS